MNLAEPQSSTSYMQIVDPNSHINLTDYKIKVESIQHLKGADLAKLAKIADDRRTNIVNNFEA